MITFLVLSSIAALIVSWLLTGAVRRYALASSLMDTPNERSSHNVPTPRGGGVSIVITFLAASTILGLIGRLESQLVNALTVSGILVATLGFIDDRRGLPASLRFVGHVFAAIWVFVLLGNAPRVPIFGVALDLQLAGSVLCVLFIVWMINLFNFMDGIDGIAGTEAVSVCLAGAWLSWATSSDPSWIAAVLFAACVAGFLLWNFPPAKIFMGDAGSGFLGLVVAALALWCGHARPVLFWSWLILLGCFMVDATFTLVRRVHHGEHFAQAHRSHAYQYASRLYGSHRKVTIAILIINLLWLLPMAALVAFGQLDGLLGIAMAYMPLVALAFRFKAGNRAQQEL